MGARMRRFLLAATAIACLAATPTAGAQTPPSLTGETLIGDPGAVTVSCQGSEDDFTIRWDVSGRVTSGPYPGTFHETGSHTGPGIDVVTARFEINSSAGTVTGNTRYVFPAPLAATPCNAYGAGSFGRLRYEATIVSPEGAFADQGAADMFAFDPFPAGGNETFNESFVSDLSDPIPLRPTSKEQCKNGGWRNFGTMFKTRASASRSSRAACVDHVEVSVLACPVPSPFGGMMKLLVALAGSLLALVCLTAPAGAKQSPPPVAQQDSARATGDAPNTAGSGGYFNIDISAQSGPTGRTRPATGRTTSAAPPGCSSLARSPACRSAATLRTSGSTTRRSASARSASSSSTEGSPGRPRHLRLVPRQRHHDQLRILASPRGPARGWRRR